MPGLFATHFSAIMGYGFGFIMIFFLAVIPEHRFDGLVNNLVPAWFASIITYISVKVIGEKDPVIQEQVDKLTAVAQAVGENNGLANKLVEAPKTPLVTGQ